METSNLPRNFIKNGLRLSLCKTLTTRQKPIARNLLNWDYYNNFNLPYLYGPPGVGKTYLAVLMALELIYKHQYEVFYTSFSDFFIEYFGDKTKIHRMKTALILICDDFGAHNVTKQNVEALHSIISSRLNTNRATMITSNIEIMKIGDYLYDNSDRKVAPVICKSIQDRVLELCSIHRLEGESIRVKKALERIESDE